MDTTTALVTGLGVLTTAVLGFVGYWAKGTDDRLNELEGRIIALEKSFAHIEGQLDTIISYMKEK